MKITIRPLESIDIDALVDLDSRGSNVPFGRRGIEGELNLSVSECLGAFSEESILCGFLLCHRIDTEVHILNLVVDPDYRRRGIARQLMNVLMESSINTIYLEVRSSNEAARSLYHQLSFYETGSRKNYYQMPVDDAVLMTWQRTVDHME